MRSSSQLLVSAIVPTTTGSLFLDQTVGSIIGQTYEQIETIVVNEGKERSTQRNIGAQRATGDIFWSTDDDYIFDACLIEQAVRKIEEGYDAVIVHGTSVSRGWLSEVRMREKECFVGSWQYEAACIFTRRAFFAIGGFDERLNAFEDHELQHRLDQAGFKTARITARAYHLGEPNSLKEIVRKYAYYGQRENILPFAAENPGTRLWQLLPFRLVYIRNLRKFGLWFFPFLVYHYVKYAAALVGFLDSIL